MQAHSRFRLACLYSHVESIGQNGIVLILNQYMTDLILSSGMPNIP